MARSYAKLYLSVWDNGGDFLDLTADAQWLYWVLISHPLLTPAGTLPLQPRKWVRRAKGMTYKRIQSALSELVDNNKILVDEDTEELLIRTYIRYDRGWRTPNIRKSIEASISRIESDALRDAATHELTHAETLADRIA